MAWPHLVFVLFFGLALLLTIVAGDLRLAEIVGQRSRYARRHEAAKALIQRIVERLTSPPPPPEAGDESPEQRRERLLSEIKEGEEADLPGIMELIHEYARDEPGDFAAALRQMVRDNEEPAPETPAQAPDDAPSSDATEPWVLDPTA